MGSIYHAPMHPGVYHSDADADDGGGAWFFRWFKIPNIKFSRFTPIDLFFSAVYRRKLPTPGRVMCIFPRAPPFSLPRLRRGAARGGCCIASTALIYSLRGSLAFVYFAAVTGKLILDNGVNKFLPTANETRRITNWRNGRGREKEIVGKPGGGHLRDYPKKTFTRVPRIRRYLGLNNLQNWNNMQM